MKDVEGVAKTKSWLAELKIMDGKVLVSMGNNSIKNSRVKILKPQAHLHIIGRKSKIIQMDPMKDVGGVRRQGHG